MSRPLLVLLTWLMTFTAVHAATPTPADAERAYRQKDFVRAARLYEALDSTHGSVYSYNLGCCYYRLNDYARAVLHYRRAVRLNPSDKDAAFNLELTQTKLQDHFDEPSEMFFFTWGRTLVNAQSATAWGKTALAFLFLTFILLALYLLGGKLWLRKAGFYLGVLTTLLALASWLFAHVESSRYDHSPEVVVMEATETYDGPSETAHKVKTLHEGTLLRLTDATDGKWQQAEMPDGKRCWLIPGKNVEKI